MCGVVGCFSPEGKAHRAPLGRALDALASRGPDGRGSYLAPDGRVALGHVRLAVRDLAGGAQPIASEDSSIHAVVNGEIYDAARLRKELESRGHRFRTRSDSELVVHLYEEHGTGLVTHLRGEFAFVLWDERSGTLVAARDRFGIKPLVYAERGGELLVASQAKALFALGLPALWDAAAVFQATSLHYPCPDTTLFAGVRSLPPGHRLVARPGSLRIEPYWDLDFPLVPAPIGDDEATARFLELFDDAVRQRLEAEVPVAFQLSGGIDSASVLATAVATGHAPAHAFTVSFPGAAEDEEPLARAIADHLGASLHVVEATPARLAAAWAPAVAAGEGLAVNAHLPAKYLLAQAVRAGGFRVVLTGEGADEVLAGYAHFRADHEGSAARVAATNGASAGLMLPWGEALPLAAAEARLGYVPTFLQAKAGLGHRVRGLLRPGFLAAFDGLDPAARMLDSFPVRERMTGRGPVEQSSYLWSKLALEGYILRTLGDGMEMAHGLEGRLPFLDHPLADWLLALPLSCKLRGHEEKAILRRAMGGRLPDLVRRREKHPFVGPALAGEMLTLAQDTAHSAAFADLPFVDAAAVQAALAALPGASPAQQKALDPALFLVISAAHLASGLGLSGMNEPR
jgi:asparagine synthase (glutamine-hydrolysing)